MAKFSAGGQSRQESFGIQLPGFATQGVATQQRGPTHSAENVPSNCGTWVTGTIVIWAASGSPPEGTRAAC